MSGQSELGRQPVPAGGMATGGLDVVTGAFGYSGAAIARELLVAGRRVRTLTARPAPATAAGAIEVHALDFDDPVGLVDSLQGATTLYNTYWVRLPRGGNDHRAAAANSRALFHAARRAGVERIVHVSITHPDIRSPYTYFRGKAEVERALVEVGIPYAVLRPAVLFGGSGGVLFNNIAWLLRHLPVFAIGGRGDYRVRAIHVDDLARLALSVGATRTDLVLDAVGPERPTFIELVDTVRQAVGSRARLVRVPGPVVPLLASALGVALRDVLLSREEFRAMADGLADTEGPASGETALSSWVWDHREMLGRRYAKDLR